jgi:hypothetical protein
LHLATFASSATSAKLCTPLTKDLHILLGVLQEGNNGSEPVPGGLTRGLTLEKLLSRGDAELVAMLGSSNADNMLNLSNTFGSGDLDHLVSAACCSRDACPSLPMSLVCDAQPM